MIIGKQSPNSHLARRAWWYSENVIEDYVFFFIWSLPLNKSAKNFESWRETSERKMFFSKTLRTWLTLSLSKRHQLVGSLCLMSLLKSFNRYSILISHIASFNPISKVRDLVHRSFDWRLWLLQTLLLFS